jgi:predicted DNA-binding transcriptional regulator AlpA
MSEKKWINEKEVSALTGIALPTLRNHRFLGRGLPYTKTFKSIRYSTEDVIQFMESRRIATSDAK